MAHLGAVVMDEEKPDVKAGGLVRLTRGQKWLVFSMSVGIWLTGALWLLYKYFMRVPYEFGLKQDPLEAVWQKFHGGLAFAATFVFGLLWGVHVVKGWDVRWRRRSGGTLFGTIAFLIVSGCALYYVTGDRWRHWTAVAHWAVGLAALLFFLVHWQSRTKPKRR
jgi:hypothetical protein